MYILGLKGIIAYIQVIVAPKRVWGLPLQFLLQKNDLVILAVLICDASL